jgi:hypothetical protein
MLRKNVIIALGAFAILVAVLILHSTVMYQSDGNYMIEFCRAESVIECVITDHDILVEFEVVGTNLKLSCHKDDSFLLPTKLRDCAFFP